MFRLPNNVDFLCLAAIVLSVFLFGSCLKDKTISHEYGGFPSPVGNIVGSSCSTTGCHTTQSKFAAGGISMSSWDELMAGGNNGNAYVIPFAPEQSPFLYSVNSYPEFGPTLSPKMPFNAPALSKEQVLSLYNWIANGAPNSEGQIKFSDNAGRNILYIVNAQCNKVALIDLETNLAMRYVDINGGGFAEEIEVSRDGEYYYILHQSGVLKKYTCLSNAKIKETQLGAGFWRSMVISPNSKRALAADWSGNSDYNGGQIALIDLESMEVIKYYNIPSDSVYFPFGITVNNDFSVAYCSCQTGNFIYKIDLTDELNPIFSKVALQHGESLIYTASPYRPGQVTLSPNGEVYFVVCEKSDEIRIYNTSSDELIAINSVGKTPQNMVVSEEYNIYAVSCMEDQSSFEIGKGSVIIFDLATHTEIKRIYTGYQPKSINLHENYIYVVNRNADIFGADAPHHYSGCQGNNGYLTRIDLLTLSLVSGYKAELNVNPYAAAIR